MPDSCNAIDCNTPDSSVLQYLLEFAQVHVLESVMLSNHFITCHALLLLPLIFPSISVFSNDLALQIRWPKYWSFSFIICPTNEYSFRIDWFDLLAVQKTLKSLLQHHSLKASALSLPYRPTLTSIHDY